MTVERSARETVLSFINALNNEDFTQARQYTDSDLLFVGVLGSRHGADAYFADMEKMRLKYEVKKVFADGDDVCLWSEIRISGVAVLTASWYQVKDSRVHSLKVVFDPRPVLAAKPA